VFLKDLRDPKGVLGFENPKGPLAKGDNAAPRNNKIGQFKIIELL